MMSPYIKILCGVGVFFGVVFLVSLFVIKNASTYEPITVTAPSETGMQASMKERTMGSLLGWVLFDSARDGEMSDRWHFSLEYPQSWFSYGGMICNDILCSTTFADYDVSKTVEIQDGVSQRYSPDEYCAVFVSASSLKAGPDVVYKNTYDEEVQKEDFFECNEILYRIRSTLKHDFRPLSQEEYDAYDAVLRGE